jgi:hypothetical protein
VEFGIVVRIVLSHYAKQRLDVIRHIILTDCAHPVDKVLHVLDHSSHDRPSGQNSDATAVV